MSEQPKDLATTIIQIWAGDLLKARDNGSIPQFVKYYYYENSFFKPTLAAFVKNQEDMINYFESFSQGLIGFAPGANGMSNPNVIQANWIGEGSPKLVAKGTYNFLFEDPASPAHAIVVRADFSFIFSEVEHEKAKIFLQHSSLQVKERIPRVIVK